MFKLSFKTRWIIIVQFTIILLLLLLNEYTMVNCPVDGRDGGTPLSAVNQRRPNIVKSTLPENTEPFMNNQKHITTEPHRGQEGKIHSFSLNSSISGLQTTVFRNITQKHIFQDSTTSDFVLFSAIVGNSSQNATWDRIALQGWEAESIKNKSYVCCVVYRSGHFQKFHTLIKSNVWIFGRKVPMAAKQFICPSKYMLPGDIPVKVALSVSACHKQYDLYTSTVFAYMRSPNQIAVCTKLAYGNLPADDILSWFEVHKLMGVNKVLTYTYGLNKNASKVLEHYAREGIAEVVPFFLPHRDPNITYVGQEAPQYWNDEQIAVFDCLERLKGYTYLATFDFDEYMVPTTDETWTSLFTRLWRRLPDAAGFFFKVQLHMLSWEPTDKSTQFKIGRYLNRTAAIQDRMKHVVIPGRLKLGGLNTHGIQPRTGFENLQWVPHELATIHHFRHCRKEWVWNNSTMCYKFARFHDDTVARLLKKVESRLLELKAALLV